ncbi:HNH endonuclease [Empedobacter sp. 189-2]|uniref:HNH endonuclease n=1 Tax=Empedobacter sp. 189-2 TaxID=2746724 RepID=UPI0025750F0A|nr:HNH endonuclease [Empedobacter sp. 189-2]MDM1542349.1 HNH endonuclease [Empedobacter sp. 189-2]
MFNNQNTNNENNVNTKKYENKIERVDFSEFHWDNKTQTAYYKGRKLTQSVTKTGYVDVHLEAKSFRLHKLIAHKYISNSDASYTIVDHINESKDDNRLVNLRWLNNSENMAKAYRLRKEPVIRKDYIYKVTPTTDTSISFYFDKRKEVAEFIQRSERAVSFALDGTTNSSGGYFITRTEVADGYTLTGF